MLLQGILLDCRNLHHGQVTLLQGILLDYKNFHHGQVTLLQGILLDCENLIHLQIMLLQGILLDCRNLHHGQVTLLQGILLDCENLHHGQVTLLQGILLDCENLHHGQVTLLQGILHDCRNLHHGQVTLLQGILLDCENLHHGQVTLLQGILLDCENLHHGQVTVLQGILLDCENLHHGQVTLLQGILLDCENLHHGQVTLLQGILLDCENLHHGQVTLLQGILLDCRNLHHGQVTLLQGILLDCRNLHHGQVMLLQGILLDCRNLHHGQVTLLQGILLDCACKQESLSRPGYVTVDAVHVYKNPCHGQATLLQMLCMYTRIPVTARLLYCRCCACIQESLSRPGYVTVDAVHVYKNPCHDQVTLLQMLCMYTRIPVTARLRYCRCCACIQESLSRPGYFTVDAVHVYKNPCHGQSTLLQMLCMYTRIPVTARLRYCRCCACIQESLSRPGYVTVDAVHVCKNPCHGQVTLLQMLCMYTRIPVTARLRYCRCCACIQESLSRPGYFTVDAVHVYKNPCHGQATLLQMLCMCTRNLRHGQVTLLQMLCMYTRIPVTARLLYCRCCACIQESLSRPGYVTVDAVHVYKNPCHGQATLLQMLCMYTRIPVTARLLYCRCCACIQESLSRPGYVTVDAVHVYKNPCHGQVTLLQMLCMYTRIPVTARLRYCRCCACVQEISVTARLLYCRCCACIQESLYRELKKNQDLFRPQSRHDCICPHLLICSFLPNQINPDVISNLIQFFQQAKTRIPGENSCTLCYFNRKDFILLVLTFVACRLLVLCDIVVIQNPTALILMHVMNAVRQHIFALLIGYFFSPLFKICVWRCDSEKKIWLQCEI